MIDSGLRAVFFDAVGTLLFPRTPVGRTYAEHARRHGAAVTENEVRPSLSRGVRPPGATRPGGRLANGRSPRAGPVAGHRRRRPARRGRRSRALPACGTCFRSPAAWTVHPEAGDVLARAWPAAGWSSGSAPTSTPGCSAWWTPSPSWPRPAAAASSARSSAGGSRPRSSSRPSQRAAGCAPAEILYVGDDPRNDVQGATAAGLRAVLFDPRAELECDRTESADCET